MNYKFLLVKIEKFNTNCRKISKSRLFLFKSWIDEIICFALIGSSPDDYFRYEFYKKTYFERTKYLTYGRSKKVIKSYNDFNYRYLFNNKIEFNKFFNKYIQRDWIDLSVCSEQSFEAFLKKHGKIIIKPVSGGQGRNIFVLSESHYNNYFEGISGNYIAEEMLVQHHLLNNINPHCVNTVRVLTFNGEIVACTLKIGGGDSPVDNMHLSNGICCNVDIENGIIDCPCLDNAGEYHIVHPQSNVQLVGFKIPNWDILRKTVSDISSIVPEIGYVGWDVAVLEDGVAIIEGNHDPGHDIVQMISQKGIYNKIKNLQK